MRKDGIEVAGLWAGPNAHEIYIAAPFVLDQRVIMHEMLHERIGRPGHPVRPFVVPCGVM